MKIMKMLIISAILSLVIILAGCNDKINTQGEDSDTTTNETTVMTTPDSTTSSLPRTTKPPPTTTEPPPVTTEPEVVVDDTELINNLALEIPNDAPVGYSSIQNAGGFEFGWSPGVLYKHVPEGTPDYFENARNLIDYNQMTLNVGVVDLLTPNGYRHIDDSGILHPSSVIKIWIAEYAYLQIYNGSGNLNDVIAGATLQYHINEMMQMSDNTSTSHVIAYFGRANIDSWVNSNYGDTHLYSDLRGYSYLGRTNCTSVVDTMAILEKIYRNRGVEPYATILNTMFNARTRAKLPTALSHHPNVRVASKTGSYIYYGAADHDIGIVEGYDEYGNLEFAFAIAIYTFSRAYQPTFSTARPTLYGVASSICQQFRDYAVSLKNPPPVETEPLPIETEPLPVETEPLPIETEPEPLPVETEPPVITTVLPEITEPTITTTDTTQIITP